MEKNQKKIRLHGYVDDPEYGGCWELVRCPCCRREHYIAGSSDDFSFANVYGEAHDPEDMMDISCSNCENMAGDIAGPELEQMAKDGDIEYYDESIREIVLLKYGATVHLNA